MLWQNHAVLNLQLEAEIVSVPERHEEVAGVKNAPQFFLNSAQNLVLIQA